MCHDVRTGKSQEYYIGMIWVMLVGSGESDSFDTGGLAIH